MPDPFGWLLSQNLYYFRQYKSQVEPGYKGHPIEFMVDFLRPIRTILDHWRPYNTILNIVGPFLTL